MEPVFLRVEDVLLIHDEQIREHGGHTGVRDIGLLASAVELPRSTFEGQRLHADLFEMAAAYLFHIVNNHPFVDGNRGTGAGAALFFPDLNGVALDVDVDEDALADHVLAVAEGLIVKREIAEFLRTMRSA